MGKISSGCDIEFRIAGLDVPIVIGSELTFEETSLVAIAKTLLKNKTRREELSLAVRLHKHSILHLIGEKKDFLKQNEVNNGTVEDIIDLYPEIDWENTDQSTKLLITNGVATQLNLSTVILNLVGSYGNTEQVFIINPYNIDQVRKINEYLKVKYKLNEYSDETKTIIENSSLIDIYNNFNLVKDYIIKRKEEYNTLNSKKDPTKSEKDKLIALKFKIDFYERVLNFNPGNAVDILEHYMSNKSSYDDIIIVTNGKGYILSEEFNSIIRLLQGLNLKEGFYNDEFANAIVEKAKYTTILINNKYIQGSSISYDELRLALSSKLLQLKLKEKRNKDEDKLVDKINEYLNKFVIKPKDITAIFELITDSTDDEFSYQIYSIDSKHKKILLKNVPKTLEERYPDIPYDSYFLMKMMEEYKGYKIYYHPGKKKYFYTQHLLTTKSYGLGYSSLEQCILRIDNRIRTYPINKDTLLELKMLKSNNVIYTPNYYIPGQVISTIDIDLNFNTKLNDDEANLIYNSGLYNENTLSKFYNYIISLIEKSYLKVYEEELPDVIYTSEQAACFIYLLNEKLGVDRSSGIKHEDMVYLLNKIKEASSKKRYYIVDYQGSGFYNSQSIPNKTYYTQDSNKSKLKKQIHKTVIIPVADELSENELVKLDDKTGALLPAVRLLQDIANKIEAKLGIKVHIENLSRLEDLFKKWKQEMPSDVRGFIKDGEIYINASNASSSDLFHEYTHIMLGILKAKNYDNYYKLLQLIMKDDIAQSIKTRLAKIYTNMADQDLNEEVFAELFGLFLSGKSFDNFINGELSDCKKAVDEKMGSIFGANPLTEEFTYGSLNNIQKQFGYDLGMLMKESNGLDFKNGLSEGVKYRQASNWISDLMKKYNEALTNDLVEDKNVGIYLECK